MRYFGKRHVFLFRIVDQYIMILNNLEDEFDYESKIESIQIFCSNLSGNFVEVLFKAVYEHINDLELNLHNTSDVNINHIKNICTSILCNKSIKEILFNIKNIISDIKSSKKFDIRCYLTLFDLVEELDFISTFELYSYLLNEDTESVLNFVLNKMNESVEFNNNESLQSINNRFLMDVEHKLNIFKRIYDDEDISMIVKNNDHVLYKINNVLKIVQLVK